jgi:hypothetical protein
MNVKAEEEQSQQFPYSKASIPSHSSIRVRFSTLIRPFCKATNDYFLQGSFSACKDILDSVVGALET